MTPASTTLYMIAHEGLVSMARSSGRATGSWAKVEPRWKPAYQWMVGRMRDQGVEFLNETQDTPPLWAWHSCGGWQAPPGRETVDQLLGLEAENRAGLWMVTVRASSNRFLLSRYGPWCQVLDLAVAGEPFDSVPDVLFSGSSPYRPSPWNQEDDLQASLMFLDWREVLSVAPLDACG